MLDPNARVFIPNNHSSGVFQESDSGLSEITPSVCDVSTPNLSILSKESWERGESTTGTPSVCNVSTPNLSILIEESWERGESTNTGTSDTHQIDVDVEKVSANYFNGITTCTPVSEEISGITSRAQEKDTEERPTTHVFFQNRAYTYNHLPFADQKTSTKKSKSNEVVVSLGDSHLNPEARLFIPSVGTDDQGQKNPHVKPNIDARTKLREIRVKNVNNVIIGHLNINSLRNKFHALCPLIHGYLDILVVGETKLDETFPEKQFLMSGYKKPYRLDGNANGGGIMIYVREDIPSDTLQKHKIHENIEAIFIEINLRKNKLLLVGIYHSTNAEYGTSDAVFFDQLGFALDVYSNYDKFLLAGDFNAEEGKNESLDDLMDAFHAKNMVKEPTCFKNPQNPSCIDLFITNSCGSFQKTTTVSTGLSDFHKMIVTVLKTSYPKAQPKEIPYREFSKYNVKDFQQDLKVKLEADKGDTYDSFQTIFLDTLNVHAPQKNNIVRTNQKPYATKKRREKR